jgi:hypothetical protein
MMMMLINEIHTNNGCQRDVGIAQTTFSRRSLRAARWTPVYAAECRILNAVSLRDYSFISTSNFRAVSENPKIIVRRMSVRVQRFLGTCELKSDRALGLDHSVNAVIGLMQPIRLIVRRSIPL